MEGTSRNYIAGGAITKHRLVKFSADSTVVQATAASDLIIGVCNDVSVVAGERVDIIRDGFAQIEFGGAVTRGTPITSDANGKGVAAAPAAGVRVTMIATAEITQASGDIGWALLTPGQMTGP